MKIWRHHFQTKTVGGATNKQRSRASNLGNPNKNPSFFLLKWLDQSPFLLVKSPFFKRWTHGKKSPSPRIHLLPGEVQEAGGARWYAGHGGRGEEVPGEGRTILDQLGMSQDELRCGGYFCRCSILLYISISNHIYTHNMIQPQKTFGL